MPNEAFFTAAGNYQSAEFRRLLSQIYTVDAGAPGGVIHGMVVTPVTGGVSVSSGAIYVLDSTGGGYIGYSTTASTVTIAAATTAGRIDTVYAFIQDPGSGATAGEMAVGVVTNGPAPSGASALAIPLATVTVNDNTGVGPANPLASVAVQADQITTKSRYQLLTREIGFTSPVLSPGWGNNDSSVNAGSAEQFVGKYTPYFGTQYKVTGNVVHMRGSITNLSADASLPIITVPAAYTPRDTQQFIVTTDDTTVGYDTWEIVGTRPDFGDPRTVGGIYGKFRGRWTNAWFSMVWTVNP